MHISSSQNAHTAWSTQRRALSSFKSRMAHVTASSRMCICLAGIYVCPRTKAIYRVLILSRVALCVPAYQSYILCPYTILRGSRDREFANVTLSSRCIEALLRRINMQDLQTTGSKLTTKRVRECVYVWQRGTCIHTFSPHCGQGLSRAHRL